MIEKLLKTIPDVGKISVLIRAQNKEEATKRLNEEGLSFEVWLIGDGKEKDLLKQYMSDNEISNVRLLGVQSNPYPYIRVADMLISTSLHEAYGLTISEAFILEKPVLSTDCVGPRELLDNGKYGILVENTTDGIYKGMREVLTEREKYVWCCERAKERAGYFESDIILDEIEKLIN